MPFILSYYFEESNPPLGETILQNGSKFFDLIKQSESSITGGVSHKTALTLECLKKILSDLI